jgi:hypothetical protein
LSIDDTLALWAASIHLPAATASEIYQRLVTTPAGARSPGLDPAWWGRYAADVTARMMASTQLTPWAA